MKYNTNLLRQDLRRIGLNGMATGIANHIQAIANKSRDNSGDVSATIPFLNRTIENALDMIELAGGDRSQYVN